MNTLQRLVIGTLVGAVVVFVWGFLSWAAIGIWEGHVRAHPGGDAAAARLIEGITEDGAYYLPSMSSREAVEAMTPEQAEADMQAWTERHKQGPLVTLLVRKTGMDPMGAGTFVGGIAIDLFGAFVMSLLMLTEPTGGRRRRYSLGVAMAAFAAVTSHGSNWNWFHLPNDWSLALGLDLFIGWLLCAAVLALILGRSVATRTQEGGGAA